MNDPKTISLLIKPSSALCNLRCRYCFYMDESKNRDVPSHGQMDEKTTDLLISRIAEDLNNKGIANISFQGGEPLVSGIGYFKHFIEKMKEYPDIETHYSLQTNGTLINDEFVKLFKDNNFLIGVSLDGYEENMNRFRVGPGIENVYEKVLEGIGLLKEGGVDFNILTVITRDLAKHPRQLFDFYLDQNYEYVQLISCLPAFGVTDDGMSLRPEDYASFYIGFFNEWKKAYLKGRYINVNLFENIIAMLQGQYPYQGGMLGRCIPQLVVESNGDVFPCDFYCLDEYRMGNIKDMTIKELRQSNGSKHLMNGSDCEKKICGSCRYRNICHGGCQRQNVCYLKDDSCAYQKALDVIVPGLYELIKR